MRRKLSSLEIDACAMAAHEMNRVFNRLMGDTSYPVWEQAPEWAKNTARYSVIAIAEHDYTPTQLHESWVAEKRAQGWILGNKKDFDNKIHPCLVPYAELPEDQRIKDDMWCANVRIMLDAFWRIPQ